jgi:hypothetical protein
MHCYTATRDILAQYLFYRLSGVQEKRETVVREHIGRHLFEDTTDGEKAKQRR